MLCTYDFIRDRALVYPDYTASKEPALSFSPFSLTFNSIDYLVAFLYHKRLKYQSIY